MEHCKKTIQIEAFIIFLVLFVFCKCVDVQADDINFNNVILYGLTEEEAEARLQSASIRYSSEEELKDSLFEQLLISDDWIAVGNNNKVVGVFNYAGELKYCIKFATTGMYSLYYDSNIDGLSIKIVRNDTYYTFDSNGHLMKIMDYRDNNTKGLLDSQQMDKNGNRYYLKSERQISSLFLKRSINVIKCGAEENVFLKSKYRFGFVFWTDYLLNFITICVVGIVIYMLVIRKNKLTNRKKKF